MTRDVPVSSRPPDNETLRSSAASGAEEIRSTRPNADDARQQL
jgi:hypothetical protein